jgi:4-hydroxybenzoate polyprenyltransferase
VNRWWIYQRERFPVFAWTAFITAVCLGVLAFSAQMRGAGAISAHSFIVAFVCTILVFLQLRIADEFKDFEDDSAARPYRPVQRGLVTLRELRFIASGALGVQIALARSLHWHMLIPLGIVLLYLLLMTREFFVARWLRAHPTAYLLSHQLILPLIYFFIAACDWLPAGAAFAPGLVWILVMSYASGPVVEIGRKIRAPEDEEKGVETYSALWGRRGAIIAWLVAVALSGAAATRAAMLIGFGRVVGAVALVLFCVLVVTAIRFLARPVAGAGKKIDLVSGLWTVAIHGALAASLLR